VQAKITESSPFCKTVKRLSQNWQWKNFYWNLELSK